MADKDVKVQDVLNCFRRHRMKLVTFIETFFVSQLRSASDGRGRFFADEGMRCTFHAMLENSEYALRKRQMAKRAMQLYDDFGPYFKHIIIRMLQVEVNEVAQDALMHRSPIDVSPQACEEFNLWNYEALYKSKAPILFGIIQVLCCVPSAVKEIRQVDIGEPLLDVERMDEEEDIDPEIDQPDNHDGEYLWEKMQADMTSTSGKKKSTLGACTGIQCIERFQRYLPLVNDGALRGKCCNVRSARQRLRAPSSFTRRRALISANSLL